MTTAGRPEADLTLTEAERDALDQALADSGCHGFLGDHPDLYAAAELILAARTTALLDRLAEAEAKEVDDGRCRHRWNCSDHGLDALCDCRDAGRSALTGGDR